MRTLINALLIAKLATAGAIAASLLLPFAEGRDPLGVRYSLYAYGPSVDAWASLPGSFFVAPLVLVVIELRLHSSLWRLVLALAQLPCLFMAYAFTQATLVGWIGQLVGADIVLTAIPVHAGLSVLTGTLHMISRWRGRSRKTPR